MKFRIVKIVLVISMFMSFPLMAEEEGQKTVTSVGVQKESTVYFRVAEGWDINCSYGAMYLQVNTDFGKAALSSILTAKSTSKKLSRVVYTQEANGMCQLYLIEVQ